MKIIKRIFLVILSLTLLSAFALGMTVLYVQNADWGFARSVSPEEQQLRLQIVAHADSWLGTPEGSNEHANILDIYNNHTPLAQGYLVKSSDDWCATFASCVAIQCGYADIIPTECGCQRQISLWQELGCWEENDNYIPLPGDYIYYAWGEDFNFDDCTGWADHVGIVIGTAGPFIKVIEGNKDDCVTYRIILRGNYQIRGYGLPDYASKIH